MVHGRGALLGSMSKMRMVYSSFIGKNNPHRGSLWGLMDIICISNPKKIGRNWRLVVPMRPFKIDKTHKKEYDKHDIIWGIIYIFGGLIFMLT